jgi:hypothetical protein
MLVTVDLNQRQANCEPKGGQTWECSYETAQKFVVSVTAQMGDIFPQKLGLTQTLVNSTRIATYATGGQLSISPHVLPCLDGDDSMIPWYNLECQAKDLLAAHDKITFTLVDTPHTNVPGQVKDPQDVSRNITGLEVSETFLITLFNAEEGEAKKQWTWSYSYNLAPDGGNIYRKPLIIGIPAATLAIENGIIAPIVLVGPVATENPVRTLSPGWHFLD